MFLRTFRSWFRVDLKMSNEKKGWEVDSCEITERGLKVTGVNHETTDPLFKLFSWHINEFGLKDSRYDFSGCVFKTEQAKQLYEHLKNKK